MMCWDERLPLLGFSEYDLGTERRRAEERAGDTQWVRRFPHERGNWPTYIFVPGAGVCEPRRTHICRVLTSISYVLL